MTNIDEYGRTILRTARESHLNTPFPANDADEELGDLHAELVLYDDQVAGAVECLLNSGRVPGGALARNTQLAATLRQIIALADARQRRASEYLAYLEHLHQLIDEVEKVAPQH